MIWTVLGHFNGLIFGLIVLGCAFAYIASQIRQAAYETALDRVEGTAKEWHRAMRRHWIEDHPNDVTPPTWDDLAPDVRDAFRALVFKTEAQARNH